MRDTNPERTRDYYARLAKLTTEQRGRMVASLTSAVRKLAVAGIRERHPDASEQEVRVRLAVRLYGRAVGERLFGEVPPDAI